MFTLIVVWATLLFLTFGIPGISYISMRKAAKKPWRIKINEKYSPSVSIIVPTYNESQVINHKMENLAKLEYPKELTHIIVVDSNSTDGTIEKVSVFAKQHPNMKIETLEQSERMGKTVALNYALKYCKEDVIIVSDADCFWPSDILNKALPFLANSSVVAISGPKLLLNADQSWVTRTEDSYLRSMNLKKLGESKTGSTLFFEGGFSAYKKEALNSFDPYNTGSDDCGTVIRIAEDGSRAILVPDAEFFTAFPVTWKGKMDIKIRRTIQLVRVFATYFLLLLRNRVKSARAVALESVFMYIINPFIFLLFVIATLYMLFNYPYVAVVFLVFLIPRVGVLVLETVQSYLLLLVGILSLILNKRVVFWSKPEDRAQLTEEMLRERALI
ncbi:MAG TPA: glycosyltransferase [Candidatus Bathyarchaeia archaeon]|nr:glycosyltransferase [Candidatus Bathyarchaeia archaeon]